MDMKEIQELAKAAAQSAVIAHSIKNYSIGSKEAVDLFLESYEYGIKQILERQNQAQNGVNSEFEEFRAKFR